MKIKRRKPLTARVGVFGVGYHVYWNQFPGLREELLGKQSILVDRVRAQGVCVEDFGLVDKAQDAYALAPRLRAADLDLVFCDMLTYATSATFAAIVRSLDVPIVLVALQPMAAMDYARATTRMQLANDDFCSIPEFLGVALRMGRPAPEAVLGTLHDDPAAEGEIAEWCRVACALHDLKRARIGHFGHPIEHMLDMQTDQAAMIGAFGCHVVQTEADDLLAFSRDISEAELKAKEDIILDLFDTPNPGADPLTETLTPEHLRRAAKSSVALDRFVDFHQLDGLAYYYDGEPGSPLRDIVTSLVVGNSLLTAAGFPMCGESDLKTCVAMMLMDRIGAGGSFAEFHPVDFREGFVLVGHDGPHHINIADGKPTLRSLRAYHGKPGNGASVEFQIKEGPITMLSIGVKSDGKFKFILAEGESRRGLIPATGNTNTRGFFGSDIRAFLKRWVREGPTHHFALGVGHCAATLARIAGILGIESAIVETSR
jgi:L-arabinose isomerase